VGGAGPGPVTPFLTSAIPGLRSALECPNLISSNSFAHRLGTGNFALQLMPGPVCDGPERTFRRLNIARTTGSNLSSMNSLLCQCRRQTKRGDKHRGRNPHALFTVAYIFLFAESSPSYGLRPVLGPSLFSVSSGRRKLTSRIPSILSAHGCILNCTLRQLIYRGRFCHRKCKTGSITVT